MNQPNGQPPPTHVTVSFTVELATNIVKIKGPDVWEQRALYDYIAAEVVRMQAARAAQLVGDKDMSSGIVLPGMSLL